MTAAEAFRAALRADTWDEYARLLRVALAASFEERKQLFNQQETYNRKAARS